MATAQHGVAAARQLREIGYSENAISAEAARGRWRRVHRGVYAIGHEALTWEGRCMAAVLANAPAVASHWTAAWLWGLSSSQPNGRFHLTAPSRRHRRRPFVVHFAALAAEDAVEVEGIPVTSLARTHLDLAAVAPRRLDGFLGRSEDLRLLDLRQFDALLVRFSHHPGCRPLTEALRTYRPDPAVTRSGLERSFRALLAASSLPRPSHNINVGPYELDCFWPDQRFCVELDTFATHGSRRSFEADRKRQRELRRLGVEVMRVTGLLLEREPAAILAALAEALREPAPRSPRRAAPAGRSGSAPAS